MPGATGRAISVPGLAKDALASFIDDAMVAAQCENAAVGLRTVLRAALDRMIVDAGLAEVLAVEEPIRPETIGLGRQLGGTARELMDRARSEGVLRDDVEPDDLRRLLVKLHAAVRLGGNPDRHVDILLAGLLAPER